MKRNQRRRKGYVLLVTLALVVLAGVILAGIARHSLQLALEADEAQERLQRRWGTLSCQRAVFASVDQILAESINVGEEDESDSRFQQPPSTKVTIRLGELDFDLEIADESAKVNLNTVYRVKGKDAVRQLVTEVGRSSGVHLQLPVELRPYESEAGSTAQLDSWGQVFATGESRYYRNDAEAVQATTREITCWGEGRLNVQRASDKSLERVGRLVLGHNDTRRLVELRQGQSSPTVSKLLDDMQLRLDSRRRLERLLTDRSQCYSVWITVGTSARQWHTLRILNRTGSSGTRTFAFTW